MKLKLKRPVDEKFPISSPFGKTRTISGETGMHNGIDFACPVGTPVKSFADGVIWIKGYQAPDNPKTGLGLRIWQKFTYSGDTWDGWYGHLDSIEHGIDTGVKVKEGQIVGYSGNTGRSTGPHLHVQFRDKKMKFHDAEFV